MKKKKLANILMVVIILVIVISGVLIAGFIKGWFDTSKDGALLTEHTGIITLERNGVSYTVSKDTVLRKGDRISCDTGAFVKVSVSGGYLTLGQNVTAYVNDPDPSRTDIGIERGEVFINTTKGVTLGFDDISVFAEDAVATLSVRKGASSLSIYYGSFDGANKGEMIEWIGEERSVLTLDINSLNDFNIRQLKSAGASRELIFTLEMLDELVLMRQAELYNIEVEQVPESTEDAVETADTTDATDTTASPDTDEPEPETELEQDIPEDTEPIPESEKTTEKVTEKVTEKATEKVTEKVSEAPKPAEPVPAGSCNITIRCDTILDNMSDLEAAKAPFVPADGCILPMITVDFYDGETVFDVLNRVCKQYGIQIEYSWTPLYDSYYIEGINNLYEFDCGYESGWMYKVNGWFPNYGCSSYSLSDGETVVWCFTCKGLGKDVGASGW